MDFSEQQFLQDSIAPELLAVPLPDEFASKLVDRLKREADRYLFVNPHRSIEISERIIAIGKARADTAQVALGLLARGNALKALGAWSAAWDDFQQSAHLFLSVHSDYGWARTRISSLEVALRLNQLPGAFAEAQHARAIFTARGDRDMLVRLDLQEGLVHNYLGDHQRALYLFHEGLAIANQFDDPAYLGFGLLYMNIGYAHEKLGDYHQALAYYEPVRAMLTARQHAASTDTLKTNIAYIARIQGRYRYALTLLQEVLANVEAQFPLQAISARSDLVECYLNLNRYAEARDLAQRLVGEYRGLNDAYGMARMLLNLSAAEAALENHDAAQAALDQAEQIFTSLDAAAWVATTWLWRGQLALRLNNLPAAYQSARNAAECFESGGQLDKLASATLLQAQSLFALGDSEAAATAAQRVLQIARARGVPSLRYGAHLLLGKLAERQADSRRASQRYEAAAATIDRVQSGLTITLRSGFLEDKGEALRALLALHLRAGRAERAFETLERAKAQVVLGYLMNREALRWSADDALNRTLVDELNRLRFEHQGFYLQGHATGDGGALAELRSHERQMRAIVERLYLHSGKSLDSRRPRVAALGDIQHVLSEQTLLIEYYHDQSDLWAFCLDGRSVRVQRLPLDLNAVDQLLGQLRLNLMAALRTDKREPAVRPLTQMARRILRRLHEALIQPLGLDRSNTRRLLVVPYGLLHFLPFHLLYDGSTYLIERQEMIVLPAASLALRRGPCRAPGALVLAHSWDGQLPHTLAEAQMVQSLLGGTLYIEAETARACLQAPPVQVLHIATHGEHRLDQPELSYLQLADGQMYADDLLQYDMSYELVTLSACETGRAKVAARDELIGLSRGFLYAGAGALLMSLWQVPDEPTFRLMHSIYRALRGGASKAGALRTAQQMLLSEEPDLHPAHWGGFQLMGDGGPFSEPAGAENALHAAAESTPST